MSFKEVNVNVGGPKKDALYTYKEVILKPNKGFAEQVAATDRIYVIKWDFDLGGEEVTIPENCVLEFDGGSLSNGSVVGQNTLIISKNNYIFKSVIFYGTWNVDRLYASAFGLKEGSKNAVANNQILNTYINPAMSCIKGLLIFEKDYYFSDSIFFSGLYDIRCDGILYKEGSIEGKPFINIGSTSYRSDRKEFVIQAEQIQHVDATTGKIANYGIYMKNIVESKIHIKTAKYFVYNLVLEGNNGNGFVNNIITLSDFHSLFYCGIYLKAVETGWVNENLFLGGKISNGSTTPYSDSVGIKIEGDTYYCNNNVFVKPCTENCAYPAQFINARNNTLYNIRNEGATYNCTYDNSTNNLVLDYAGTLPVKMVGTNTELPAFLLSNLAHTEIFKETIKLWASTYNDEIYNSSNLIISLNGSTAFRYYVKSSSADYETANMIKGHIIDTTNIKDFVVCSDIDTRFSIKILDENNNVVGINADASVDDYVYNFSGTGFILDGFNDDKYYALTTGSNKKFATFSVRANINRIYIGVKDTGSANILALYTTQQINSKIENLILTPKNLIWKSYNIISKNKNLSNGDYIYIEYINSYCHFYNNKLNLGPRSGNTIPNSGVVGDIFFKSNIPLFFNGTTFKDSDGRTFGARFSNTANRPSLTTSDVGFQYFDTTLNKPIFWNGSAWIDATGTTV